MSADSPTTPVAPAPTSRSPPQPQGDKRHHPAAEKLYGDKAALLAAAGGDVAGVQSSHLHWPLISPIFSHHKSK